MIVIYILILAIATLSIAMSLSTFMTDKAYKELQEIISAKILNLFK